MEIQKKSNPVYKVVDLDVNPSNSNEDIFVISTKINADNRGIFIENYRKSLTNSRKSINFEPSQHNIVYSTKHVFRGLHNSKNQSKLISCVSGKILDISVDLRQHSKNFGTVYLKTLEALKGEILFICPGFAHGYYVKSANTVVSYLLDGEYDQNIEENWNGFSLLSNLGFDVAKIIFSDKDKESPDLFQNL